MRTGPPFRRYAQRQSGRHARGHTFNGHGLREFSGENKAGNLYGTGFRQ